MSEMIDQVARALCDHHLWEGCFDEFLASEYPYSLQAGVWRCSARVALKAMRAAVPTERMQTRGNSIAESCVISAGDWEHSAEVRDECAGLVWSEMIDAALEP